MKRSLSALTSPLLALLLLLCGFALGGCNDNLYATCDLDQTSADPLVQECAATPVGGEAKSCAITNYLQCDGRVCARYNSSQPFCSKRCQTDADCESIGVCKEFVFQTNEKYCVETSKL